MSGYDLPNKSKSDRRAFSGQVLMKMSFFELSNLHLKGNERKEEIQWQRLSAGQGVVRNKENK